MTATARIAAVAVCLALAAFFPAAAFAQNGAGDDQYADPFSGGSQPANKPKPKPKPQPQQQQSAPQTAPSTQQTAPSTQQAAPSSQQSASSQDPAPTAQQDPSAQGQLPRTGLDVVPLALAGAAFLIAGLVLLRRSRAVDGRD